MSELKPCPFCGGEAEIVVNKNVAAIDYYSAERTCHPVEQIPPSESLSTPVRLSCGHVAEGILDGEASMLPNFCEECGARIEKGGIMSDCIFERWRDIPGYRGLYQASSLGRIRNKNGKVLKMGLGSGGRFVVTLRNNGVKRTHSVHRLVAEAFLVKPGDDYEVNHIDGNHQNNAVTNLEWCTKSENMSHSFALGLHKPNTVAANRRRRKKIRRSDGMIFESVAAAARASGLSPQGVSHILVGNSKHPRSYSFEYVDGDVDE